MKKVGTSKRRKSVSKERRLELASRVSQHGRDLEATVAHALAIDRCWGGMTDREREKFIKRAERRKGVGPDDLVAIAGLLGRVSKRLRDLAEDMAEGGFNVV